MLYLILFQQNQQLKKHKKKVQAMGASVCRAATPSGLAARQLSKQTVADTLTLLIAARALA